MIHTYPVPVWDSKDLILGFASGELSPVEVVQDVLDRTQRIDGTIHAFLHLDERGALDEATRAERRWNDWRQTSPSNGDWTTLPQWGLPVSVKDTIEQEGLPTTYGCAAFRDNMQPDSHAVQQLRQAGVALLGKTNTSEFALSTITANRLSRPTRNPWLLDRTAGGSSGGAAAAAALGLGAVAIGTDSAGSIRLPAAYCGVYGLKPTHGRVRIQQTWRASPIRSHIGPLGRTINDILAGWTMLTGQPARPERSGAPGTIRVGVLANDPKRHELEGDVRSRFKDAVPLSWRAAPLDVPTLPSSQTLDNHWVFAGDHLAAAEKLAPGFMAAHGAGLMEYTKPFYEQGHLVPAWEYRAALDRFEDYARDVQRVFDEVDFVVASSTGPAPHLPEGDVTLGERYETLSMWNFTGNPALVVPLGVDDVGLPRSVQLVGPLGSDLELMAFAEQLVAEGALPRALNAPSNIKEEHWN